MAVRARSMGCCLERVAILRRRGVDVFLVGAPREMVLKFCPRRLGTVSAPYFCELVYDVPPRGDMGPFRREMSLMENETRHGSRAMLFSGSGRTACLRYRCRLLQASDLAAITCYAGSCFDSCGKVIRN